jgi:hypothetical protein
MDVEVHEDLEGNEVYLPCVEHFAYGFAPCDANQDGVVDRSEKESCSVEGDPCDFNGDGVVGEYEAQQCGINDTIDVSKYDPCDFNLDGIVEGWENDQCYGISGCAPGELIFWDMQAQKDVCVPEEDMPFCQHPKYADIVKGEIACVDPCDWNRDGVLDDEEKSMCITCAENETPFWNMELNKDVCVPFEDIPECFYPDNPDFVNGTLKCVNPCDMNRDGVVDTFEEGQCWVVECEQGEMPLWNSSTGKDECVEESVMANTMCEPGEWLEARDGEAICINPSDYDPCDWNFDGIVDDYEDNMCNGNGTMGTDPCDTNMDGMVDDFEMGQCANMKDPCDLNMDGIVDNVEENECMVMNPAGDI